MFSLICAWINGWVNNREGGDLRRHRAHYVVTFMYEIEQFVPFHITPSISWRAAIRCTLKPSNRFIRSCCLKRKFCRLHVHSSSNRIMSTFSLPWQPLSFLPLMLESYYFSIHMTWSDYYSISSSKQRFYLPSIGPVITTLWWIFTGKSDLWCFLGDYVLQSEVQYIP